MVVRILLAVLASPSFRIEAKPTTKAVVPLVNSGAKLFYGITSFLPDRPLSA
jgi:hypothetical protein